MGYREIPEDRILEFPATPGFKGWEPFFTDESTTHPAKMNLNLLRWILVTYTEPGEVVLDPMAGTGSTIILASILGRHGVAVEYEPRFCDMIRENIELTKRQTTLKPKGRMTCIQGDARELSKLLGESDAIVTSPPYSESRKHDKRASDPKAVDKKAQKLEEGGWGDHHTPGRLGSLARHFSGYSTGPDNIGNLPHGDIDTVITSPPYESSVDAKGDPVRRAERMKEAGLDPKTIVGGKARCGEMDWRYSEDSGNIGNLRSETYLEAMLQVYRECWKVLKQPSKLILVTKNFIRDKQVVRLDLDTIRLCEAAGFKLVDRWYFKLPTRSFWRILYKKRFPDVPEIDYEDVIVFEKGVDIPRGKVNG